MRATFLNCSLKDSSQESHTQQLADVVIGALQGDGVECETFRLADLNLPPGITTDLGDGDDWPRVYRAVMASEIVVLATPTWVAHPSSLAQRALERMDAMISETDDDGVPVAFNKVAGVVVTGNEDGAHHVIAEISQGLGDIGFTVPGQAWTYWNSGPGPGPSYPETTHGHDWSHSTGRAMASNLFHAATALGQHPIPAPPSE